MRRRLEWTLLRSSKAMLDVPSEEDNAGHTCSSMPRHTASTTAVGKQGIGVLDPAQRPEACALLARPMRASVGNRLAALQTQKQLTRQPTFWTPNTTRTAGAPPRRGQGSSHRAADSAWASVVSFVLRVSPHNRATEKIGKRQGTTLYTTSTSDEAAFRRRSGQGCGGTSHSHEGAIAPGDSTVLSVCAPDGRAPNRTGQSLGELRAGDKGTLPSLTHSSAGRQPARRLEQTLGTGSLRAASPSDGRAHPPRATWALAGPGRVLATSHISAKWKENKS